MNNTLYRVHTAATYNQTMDKWVAQYWTLNECVKLASPLKFIKGDLVRFLDRKTPDVVDVLPCDADDDTSIRNLVFVSSTIPLAEGSDYEFKDDVCVVHHCKRVVHNGNANYILLVSAPEGIPVSILSGIERTTKDVIEFLIYTQ